MADGSLKFDTKIDTGDFDKSIAMLSKAVERFSTAVDRLSGKITNGFQEAGTAGKNAAAYIKEGKTADAKTVEILPVDGVRYTVPKYIRPTEMEDTLTVRFRVGDVYKNCAIATYFDDELISKRKRPVMAPGEMEQVILQKSKLADYSDLKHITIKIEEA